MIERAKANGLVVPLRNGTITECRAYDSMGRLSYVTALGYCKRFAYDDHQYWSWLSAPGTISNGAGRLTEVETDNCTGNSGTQITDEWFSYDKDGHMTDMWELTPHSGQYYHSTASYYGNGSVNALDLKSPSFYTLTYGLDGEGRWNALSEGSKTIIPALPGVTFTAAGQPQNMPIGTGTDYDGYAYDSNTGRMTGWTFQVGTGSSNTETGTLTWSPNGTLRTLAITDGFNSGGTQTCNFGTSSVMGYDDLGRLLSDNCGAVWSQTFSYDQDDNLTKSGNVQWSPGYSPTTNHYTCTDCTYDSNGNVTYDGTNSYGWDAFNKMNSVDPIGSGCSTSGECLTYDALGRMVELDSGDSYTEIWYTPLGKVAYMNGAAEQYAYWPTPGGGTALYTGNIYFMHKDWLGSSRIASDVVASTVLSDRAFAPYGEIYDTFGSTGVRQRDFTGDTQDILSGMYDTPNRELQGSQQGRWLSPDPAGAGWNQYAYSTNPLSSVDPSGLAQYGIDYHMLFDTAGMAFQGMAAWYISAAAASVGADGGGCSADGAAATCDMVGATVKAGGAVPCSNNNCGIGTSTPYQCVDAVCGYMSNEYVGTHENEWNGVLYSDSEWQDRLTNAREAQHEALSDLISTNSDLTWQQAYDSLQYVQTKGGNADFSWDPTVTGRTEAQIGLDIPGLDTGGCELLCRLGNWPSIHYNDSMFHLDNLNAAWAFPLGLLGHGIIDVGLGNINGQVPFVYGP